MARSMSDGAQQAAAVGRQMDLTHIPAAAVSIPYREAAAWNAGDVGPSVIARSRCVWAVTVHADFVPRSYPYGHKPRTFASYTVVFDQLSGEYLGLSAGTSAGDVITGAHITQ